MIEDCVIRLIKTAISNMNLDKIKSLDDAKVMLNKLKEIIRQSESLISTLGKI